MEESILHMSKTKSINMAPSNFWDGVDRNGAWRGSLFALLN